MAELREYLVLAILCALMARNAVEDRARFTAILATIGTICWTAAAVLVGFKLIVGAA